MEKKFPKFQKYQPFLLQLTSKVMELWKRIRQMGKNEDDYKEPKDDIFLGASSRHFLA